MLPSTGWLPRAVWYSKNGQKPPKFEASCSLVMWLVQSGSRKNGQKPSRDLLSMEQVWSKSQWMQECNKCVIILFKRIVFRRGKKHPSSGWLPPCSLVVKKIGRSPPNLEKRPLLSGNVPPYSLVVGKNWSKAVTWLVEYGARVV